MLLNYLHIILTIIVAMLAYRWGYQVGSDDMFKKTCKILDDYIKGKLKSENNEN